MRAFQVSASIVVYQNDSLQLAESIRSILSSSLRASCTIVDNSPTPALRDCAISCGADYIFPGQNMGFGRGHNLAISRYRDQAEFHLIVNPDISFAPGVLAHLYQFMGENQEVGLVMPQVRYPDGSEQRLCKLFPEPLDLIVRRFLGKFGPTLFDNRLHRYELRHIDMSVIREIPSLSGCFMFVRPAALEKAGLFDERFFMYMEDVDLCRRIGRHYRTVFNPEVFIIHHYAKGSYGDTKLLWRHVRSAIQYFTKWGWFSDKERTKLNARVQPFVSPSRTAHTTRIQAEQDR